MGLALCLVGALAASGCGDERSLGLRDGVPEAPDTDEMRRRMNLRVLSDDGQGNLVESEIAPGDFTWGTLVDDCVATVAEQLPGCTAAMLNGTTSCNGELCAASVSLCVANAALDAAAIAEVAPAQYGFTDPKDPQAVTVEITIPQQNAAGRAGLDREALTWVRKALYIATDALAAEGYGETAYQGEGSPSTCDGALATSYMGNSSWGESLATTFVDAYYLIFEGLDDAEKNILAAAMSNYDIEADDGRFARISQVASFLSQSALGHLVVGGPEGVQGNVEEPVCDQPSLSVEGRLALDFIEESALNPTLLDDGLLTTDDLIGGAVAGGNIADRLNDAMGLAGGAADLAAGGAVGFYDRVGLPRRAFTEARGYLAEQIAARGGADAPLAPTPRVGTPSMFTLHSATSGAPFRPPLAQHAMLLRQSAIASWPDLDPAYSDNPSGSDSVPTISTTDLAWPSRSYADKSVMATVDYAVSRAMYLMNGTYPAPPSGSNSPAEILGFLYANARAERTARAEICYRFANAKERIRTRLYGDYLASDIAILEGNEGLRCATQGHVEGAPCDLSNYVWNDPITANTVASTDLLIGFDQYLEAEHAVDTLTGHPEVFVVALKPGGRPGEAGAYQSLTGTQMAVLTGGGATYPYCSLRPVEKALEDRASKAFERDSENCARPAQACTLLPADLKLPLEDELIDDSDAYEDSHKYLLDRAMEAAGRADELGRQLVENGLGLDERIERASEEVEQLCGVSLDTSGYFDEDLTGVLGGACTTDAECGAGFLCAGRCVKDIFGSLSEADRDRLQHCIGSDLVAPRVTLGSEDLCIWHLAGNANAICDRSLLSGAAAERTCPSLAVDGATPAERCGGSPPGAPGDYEWEVVTTKLGLFDTTAGTLGKGPAPCAAIRTLREPELEYSQRVDLFDQIVSSGLFEAHGAAELARRLGWESKFGDFGAVTIDSRPLYTTGDPLTGTAMADWPCNGGYPNGLMAADCAGSNGFFCRSGRSCMTQGQRSASNHEMMRAVIAARITSGEGTAGITLPFIPGFADQSAFGGRSDETLAPEFGSGIVLRANDVTYSRATEHEVCGRLGVLCGTVFSLWEMDPRGQAWCSNDPFVAWTDANGTSWESRCPGVPGASAVHLSFVRSIEGASDDSIAARAALWSGFGTPREIDSYFDGWFTRWLLLDPTDPPAVLDPLVPETYQLTRFYMNPFDLEIERSNSVGNPSGLWSIFLLPLLPAGVPEFLAAGARSDIEDAWNAAQDASNQIDIGGPITRSEMLDGMELMCEVAARSGGCDLSSPPDVSNLDVTGLGAVAGYMECVANELHRRSGRMILSNVPRQAIDAAADMLATGVHPRTGGDYSGQVARFASSLVAASTSAKNISDELRKLANDIHRLQNQLEISGLSIQREDLTLLATISTQQAACVSAASPGIGLSAGGPSLSINPMAAMATCSNAYAQIDIAEQVTNLTKMQLGIQDDTAFENFKETFVDRTMVLDSQGDALHGARLEMEGALSEMETTRQSAARHLGKAMLWDTDAMGRHIPLNTAYRRRYNTTLVRYREALAQAKKLAHLARLGIEQRLGMNLEEIDRELHLVGAPSEWVNDLCDLSGIDYSEIRESERLLGPDGNPLPHYAGEFIGDYVVRLSLVLDGYRLAYPFQNASDVAVVSLRDEILQTRVECEVEVPNLLYWASRLDAISPVPPEDPMWELLDCAGPTVEPPENCVTTSALADTFEAPPFFPYDPAVAQVTGFRVRFGRDNPAVGQTTLTTSSALAQRVQLPPGFYRLSYYGRNVDPEIDPMTAVAIVSEPGSATINVTATEPEVPASGWTRYWLGIEVPVELNANGNQLSGDFYVAVRRTDLTAERQELDLAAFMLEDVTDRVRVLSDLSTMPPPVFLDTEASRTRTMAMCEDTEGVQFRRDGWTRGCTRVCSTGLGTDCEPSTTEPLCYWETNFAITLENIEQGQLIRPGGFAVGNFNYRWDDVAVNFVGTAARDCEDDALPSTCYSAGYVPYSLEHLGPYLVRNHEGGRYSAPLFMGRIEHGKGLAAERYITNPRSGADQSLLQDFYHREFRGRPMAGSYRLRVWDVQGVNFDGIEDVQIVSRYRYWTRQE